MPKYLLLMLMLNSWYWYWTEENWSKQTQIILPWNLKRSSIGISNNPPLRTQTILIWDLKRTQTICPWDLKWAQTIHPWDYKQTQRSSSTTSNNLHIMTQMLNANYPSELLKKKESQTIFLSSAQVARPRTKPEWRKSSWTQSEARRIVEYKLPKFKPEQMRSFPKWNQYQNKYELNWEMNQKLKKINPKLKPTVGVQTKTKTWNQTKPSKWLHQHILFFRRVTRCIPNSTKRSQNQNTNKTSSESAEIEL